MRFKALFFNLLHQCADQAKKSVTFVRVLTLVLFLFSFQRDTILGADFYKQIFSL